MRVLSAFLLIVFVVSALTVLGIVLGALPALSHLEVEEHPKVRERRTKHALLFGRWQRKEVRERRTKHALLFGRWQRKVESRARAFIARYSPMVEALRAFVRRLAHRVIVLERRYGFSRPRPPKPHGVPVGVFDVSAFLGQARAAEAAQQFDRAEQIYIDVLRVDQRNLEAYWGLVGVYRQRRAEREALETLLFLAKLMPEDPEVWFELARQSQQMGNSGDVLEAAEKAVGIEGANPKYLDFLCEAAILNERRDVALDAFRKLEAANPENQKLKEFRTRIKEL